MSYEFIETDLQKKKRSTCLTALVQPKLHDIRAPNKTKYGIQFFEVK